MTEWIPGEVLDETVPNDKTHFVSDLGQYIREDRVAINLISTFLNSFDPEVDSLVQAYLDDYVPPYVQNTFISYVPTIASLVAASTEISDEVASQVGVLVPSLLSTQVPALLEVQVPLLVVSYLGDNLSDLVDDLLNTKLPTQVVDPVEDYLDANLETLCNSLIDDKLEDISYGRTVITVDTVADLLNLDVVTASTHYVRTLGFYSKGDGGGADYYYNSYINQSYHDGGWCIDPNHSSIPGTAGWYINENTDSGCWVVSNYDIINVCTYGAVRNTTHDSTNAIQAAVDCIFGNPVYLPAGDYLISSQIEITGGRILFGAGRGKSNIHLYTNTQNGIYIDTNDPVTLRDFTILTCSGITKSAGAGIYLTGGTCNQFSTFERLYVMSQYIGIHIDKGQVFKIDNCYIVNSSSTGIFVSNTNDPDDGDSSIVNCVIDSASDEFGVGIYQVSSGGLKIIGNKIMRHINGIMLAPNGLSSILLIESNSIENQGGNAIVLTDYNATPGVAWSQVIINGNQIANAISGVTQGGSTDWLNYLVITNNTITLKTGGTSIAPHIGVYLTNVSYVMITGNIIIGGIGYHVGLSFEASVDYCLVGFNHGVNLDIFSSNSSPTSNDFVNFGANNSAGAGNRLLYAPNSI